MDRNEFFEALRARLGALDPKDLRPALDYYDEMISERVEAGMGEAEAVAALGSVEGIATSILAESPKRRRDKDRWRSGMLIWLGLPLWLVAAACALALWVCLWSIVVSICAAGLAIVACVPAGLAYALIDAVRGRVSVSEALFAAGCACVAAGLAVPVFRFCRMDVRQAVRLNRAGWAYIKRLAKHEKNGESKKGKGV